MKQRRVHSLKGQMVGLVLICWLIPVALILCMMGWYISDNLGQSAAENLTEQLTVNTRLCADRLDSAISASRTASSDSSIKDAWAAYQADGWWPPLYRATLSFVEGQYRNDNRFRFAAFYFVEDPERMKVGTYNQPLGVRYDKLMEYWERDFSAVDALAATLDTNLGFLTQGGELYLVRNVLASNYRPIGTLVLALNPDYYFGNLTALPWCTDVTVFLHGMTVQVKGDEPVAQDVNARPDLLDRNGGCLSARAQNREYPLSISVKVDTGALFSQFAGYRSLLIVMAVLLIPLLVFVLIFFRRKVTQPVQAMMEGAAEIERGKLGHQMDYRPNSREFQYLTDSFNHMSGQLRHQFDHIYQEELALRDARIKALQSHINPHFLNNTLEIINWEARMNGDAKVSKMIEALSTVLDAAIDRGKMPEVRLAEEMTYVSAYLYIIDQRFGKRLTVTVDIPEELLDCRVPRLILQPVIENAVEHGVGPGGHGTVSIRGRREGDLLVLDIENDGGLSAGDEAHIARLLSPEYDAWAEPSGNLGIANVNQRLRILYGSTSGLSIRREEGDLVLARLTIDQRGREE